MMLRSVADSASLLKRRIFSPVRGSAAASYGRHDAQLVARCQRRLQPILESHVLAIHVQVHEAPQRTRLVAQPPLDRRIARLQLVDDADDRRRLDLDLSRAVGCRAQRRWNPDPNAQAVSAVAGSMRTP